MKWLLGAPCLTKSFLALAAVATVVAAPAASAQEWPTKPVRLVVFGPPGASADNTARLLASELAPLIGQPVIVENKPGGAAAPAVKEMRTLPHDGHTIMLALNGLVTELPHAFKLQYNPATDLKPIAELAQLDLILVGNPKVPAKTLSELVALVKASPNKFNFGSYSPGTLSHVMGLQLNQLAGLDMTHVPFKGGTFSMNALMAGDIQLAFDVIANAAQLANSGKIHPYAVSGSKRSPLLPNVPTFRELGYPQLEESIWFPLWVPPEVPAPVQAKIRAAVLKAMDKQSVRDRLHAMGINPGSNAAPEELSARLRKESEEIGTLLRSIGFKPE